MLCWLRGLGQGEAGLVQLKRSRSVVCQHTLAQEQLPRDFGSAHSWRWWLSPVAGLCGITLPSRSLCGHRHLPAQLEPHFPLILS